MHTFAWSLIHTCSELQVEKAAHALVERARFATRRMGWLLQQVRAF